VITCGIDNQMPVEIDSDRMIGNANESMAIRVPTQNTMFRACGNPRARSDAMAPTSAAARGTTTIAIHGTMVGRRSVSTSMGTPISRANPYTTKLRMDDHTPVTNPAYAKNLGPGSMEIAGAMGVLEPTHTATVESLDVDTPLFCSGCATLGPPTLTKSLSLPSSSAFSAGFCPMRSWGPRQ